MRKKDRWRTFWHISVALEIVLNDLINVVEVMEKKGDIQSGEAAKWVYMLQQIQEEIAEFFRLRYGKPVTRKGQHHD